MKSTSGVFRFLAGVEWLGNKLPHPFWLFCLLFLAVTALSAVLSGAGVSALRPATQILKTSEGGRRVEGRSFAVDGSFEGFTIHLENALRSSRLSNIYVEPYSGERLVYEERIDRSELRAFQVTTERLEVLLQPGRYRLALVNRALLVEARSLIASAAARPSSASPPSSCRC